MKKRLRNNTKRLPLRIRRIIAWVRHTAGNKPVFSTFIDEDTITGGYGQLDDIGFFYYPLSSKVIAKHFDGFTSWRKYFNSLAK
jgi:hypothetical protein